MRVCSKLRSHPERYQVRTFTFFDLGQVGVGVVVGWSLVVQHDTILLDHGSILSSVSMSEGGHRRQTVDEWRKKLFEQCKSDSLSEEGIREIIECHGLTPNNHQEEDYEFFLAACDNDRVTEGIVRCLLEYFPNAANYTDEDGQTPLHFACSNFYVTLNIIQLLIEAAPDSVRSIDNEGWLPLHWLCVNDKVGIHIWGFLIQKHPAAVRHADNRGRLPIHIAAAWGRSPEFCRVLIEAYPGSEKVTNANGALPLHSACYRNTVAMVEYLYRQYPGAITTTTGGLYPIQAAVEGIELRDNPETALEIVQFLLDRDPNVKLQTCEGMSLLHYACGQEYNDSNIEAGIQMIKIIYNAHPEAIEDNRIVSGIEGYHQEVQVFLHIQLGHARQAKVHRLMTTPDINGQLPLHKALRNDSACFGSIKLLVKGNPAALQSADNRGRLPLHIACMHHDSVRVIQYLVGLDATTLDAVDRHGNTALHLASRGARYETIALLLDEFDAVSVSKRNTNEKLPIDLLLESDEVLNRECIEYTESVFRLLRANPEMIMGIDVQAMQSSASTSSLPCQTGKKRKLDHEERK